MSRRSARAIGWCDFHGKLLYDSRKTARKVAREHHGDHKSEYECTVTHALFHVGEVPDEVIRGEMTRTEYFRKAS